MTATDWVVQRTGGLTVGDGGVCVEVEVGVGSRQLGENGLRAGS